MIRNTRLAVMMVLVVLGAGCTPAPKITYRYDSKADFAAFKTFAMEPTKSPTLDLRTLGAKPMTQTIADSIARDLEARGLRQVPHSDATSSSSASSADLLVRWVGQIAIDAASSDITTPDVNMDPNLPAGDAVLDSGPSEGVTVRGDVTTGGIRIDLIDAKTHKPVWRGGIGAVLKPQDPDPERLKRVNAALAKLFDNYPPPTAAGSSAR